MPFSTDLKTPQSEPLTPHNESLRAVYELALLQHRPAIDIHIKQMNLLIPVHDLATVVNPKHGVLELVAVVSRLVDTDVDGQLRATGLVLKA
jgi:hypothetical protein